MSVSDPLSSEMPDRTQCLKDPSGETDMEKKSQYACKQCGKNYSYVKSFQDHISNCRAEPEVIDRKVKPTTIYTCETCGKTFDKSIFLREHKKSEHLVPEYGEKMFSEGFRMGSVGREKVDPLSKGQT